MRPAPLQLRSSRFGGHFFFPLNFKVHRAGTQGLKKKIEMAVWIIEKNERISYQKKEEIKTVKMTPKSSIFKYY